MTSQLYNVVFKAAAAATIPFILLGLGWLFGFVTRLMLDWNGFILLATLVSAMVFCGKLIELTTDTPYEVYTVFVFVILTTLVLSFIYETVDRKATTKIEKKAQIENERKAELPEWQKRLEDKDWLEKAKALGREEERQKNANH